jgi:plastocyanin
MVRWSLALGALALAPARSSAAIVRGTVTLPPELPDGRESQWRVENGVLAIGARVPDPRTEVVVVLESKGGRAPEREDAPPPTTVELHGLRLDPRVAVVPAGTTVEFKNSDRVPHTLYVERATTLMPPVPTPSGQSRSQKFLVPGEYRVRDEEFPHVQGSVVVVSTPYFTRLDERGGFRFDVPEGRYALRVYYRNGWAVSQPLEVAARTPEVAIQVPAATTPAASAAQRR